MAGTVAPRAAREPFMYQRILVPVDLADPNLAKPALESAVMICNSTGGDIRLINVLPVTPVLLAEYVPPDFEKQQRQSAEEALSIITKEVDTKSGRISSVVRQGNIHQEILEEAKQMNADLIVMSSHRVGVRTYFLGSQAGYVVRYATCSVMVVRRP
jgi:nucleotide-binding universal stress UspA family protein